MRALNTKVPVGLIARDDPRHNGRGELRGRGLCSPQEQLTTIQMLLDHCEIELDKREVVVEALRMFDARRALGFSDCLVIESARKAGHLPLGTFDRGLAKVTGAQRL
jgi:predicted nucleic-acid-binding protein